MENNTNFVKQNKYQLPEVYTKLTDSLEIIRQAISSLEQENGKEKLALQKWDDLVKEVLAHDTPEIAPA